jgi:hypothetical protein
LIPPGQVSGALTPSGQGPEGSDASSRGSVNFLTRALVRELAGRGIERASRETSELSDEF